jgi:2-polyprenyl-3-methyl-5-hydroxy-6-metoxy-1,4-benzoquinol methylase
VAISRPSIMYNPTRYLSKDFYESQLHSLNPIRRIWNRSRQETILELVTTYHREDGFIVDVGCGNCIWNKDTKYSVIGIDENKEVMHYALKEGRLRRAIISQVDNTTLPDNSVQIVVCSETLEHVDYKSTLKELHRILQPGGFLIISVPYDTKLGLWRYLFILQCFYHGKILHEDCYNRNCGHINHFSPDTIHTAIDEAGLNAWEYRDMFKMTMFLVATKS